MVWFYDEGSGPHSHPTSDHTAILARMYGKMCRWITKCIVITSMCWCVSSAAGQEQGAPSSDRRVITAEWKEILRTTVNHVLKIVSSEGMPQRSIGLMEQRGRVLQHGDIATLAAWLTYEDRAGSVSYTGYVRYRFSDGATIFGSFAGKGQAPGVQQGTISLMEGTGQFEGIQGTLAFTAASLSSVMLEGRYTMDVVGEYSLPFR